MVIYPAVLDLPHALVEWVKMLIVTREGDRRCKLRASQRAIIALVYLGQLRDGAGDHRQLGEPAPPSDAALSDTAAAHASHRKGARR